MVIDPLQNKNQVEDFLTDTGRGHKNRPWLKILMGLFLIFLIFAIPLIVQGARIVSRVMSIEKQVSRTVESIGTANWDEARNGMLQINDDVAFIGRNIGMVGPVVYLPGIRSNIQATEKLLEATSDLIIAYEKVFGIVAEIDNELKEENLTLGLATAKDRQNLFQVIGQKHAQLDEVGQFAKSASEKMMAINSDNLSGVLQQQLSGFNVLLNEAINNTNIALPIVSNLPELLGYGGEKTYLFLFQNNMEIRPTGGFIGSYGLVTVKDGEITKIFTDDIYNLDKLSIGKLNAEAPLPMQKYNNQKIWYMRDANWSPDWETSANNVLAFFNQERDLAGLEHQPVDGVIAITPDFIANILEVTGPMIAQGVTFQSENFAMDLEQFVEFDYVNYGIGVSQRKAIIGVLTSMIIDRVYDAEADDMVNLWLAFKKNIDQKHILVYLLDEEIQNQFDQENWSGMINPTEGDFLMLVDANLAALKTDSVMQKSIDYKLRIDENDDLIATVAVTYNHPSGAVQDLITRYRTYARVYVPDDTWFIRSWVQHGDDTKALQLLADVEIKEDLGKKYAATFLMIEPKDTKTWFLEYKLSEKLKKQYENGQYELFIQKQPGTIGHNLTIDLNFNQSIKSYHSEIIPQKIERKNIGWDTDLTIDREVNIRF